MSRPDLDVDRFRELLAAFVSTRAEIGNPRRAAHVVIDRRFNVPRYGWPLVTDEAAGRTFRRDLVIALLAVSDVVAVGWETPATRTDEPHPTSTRRGPDGPGDETDEEVIEGLGGGPTMGAKRREERGRGPGNDGGK